MSMGRSGAVHTARPNSQTLTRDLDDEIEVEQEELNENNAMGRNPNGEEADLPQQPRYTSDQERLSQVKQQLLHLLQRQNQ